MVPVFICIAHNVYGQILYEHAKQLTVLCHTRQITLHGVRSKRQKSHKTTKENTLKNKRRRKKWLTQKQ